jgi:hypothetical protein
MLVSLSPPFRRFSLPSLFCAVRVDWNIHELLPLHMRMQTPNDETTTRERDSELWGWVGQVGEQDGYHVVNDAI